MKQPKVKLDFKALASSELVENLSKQFTQYEKKLKELVNDFDLKSRDARTKGQKQFDKLSGQFRKTRTDVEKRVTQMLHAEGKRLNSGATELFNYLKSVAKNEKLVKQSPSKGKNASKKTRKPRAKKSATV